MAVDETLAYWQGTDYAGGAQTPRPAVGTEHAVVEAADPTDVGVARLDGAVAAEMAVG